MGELLKRLRNDVGRVRREEHVLREVDLHAMALRIVMVGGIWMNLSRTAVAC